MMLLLMQLLEPLFCVLLKMLIRLWKVIVLHKIPDLWVVAYCSFLVLYSEIKRVLRPGGVYLFVEHVAAKGS